MNILITFVILIFSAIVHEVAHGLMAERLGDDTARQEGRITLNPIPHIDPMGTIMLPLFMYIATAGRFWFGAAKPVPVNFNNLRNPKLGMALVSLAGPLANFLLAVLFVIPIKLGLVNSISYPILITGIFINLLLGTFNLIPIPPLDGSKILASLVTDRFAFKILEFEKYGFILVMFFVLMGWFSYILSPVIIGFWKIFALDPMALSMIF